jgi:hypothetical protein
MIYDQVLSVAQSNQITLEAMQHFIVLTGADIKDGNCIRI